MNKKWYEKNRDEILKRNRERAKDPEYKRKKYEASLRYKEKKENREKIRNARRKNNKRKYHNNPMYRLEKILRAAFSKALNKNGYTKKARMHKVLGCSWDEFMKHIESQFTDGMNWDNAGQYGWHIDHIIPSSSAQTEEELVNLFHYTNLQPLWWDDNLKKRNKV